ncbi:MAG: DEAD/DEAH box helicase [Oliverpabstia sp.]
MNPFRERTLGEEIYKDISTNEYLNRLYDNLLYNYSLRLLHLDRLKNIQDRPVDLDDALRFADILSNSIGTKDSDIHKTWAQEIVAMLDVVYPNNADVKYYMGSVLSKASNYRGRSIMVPGFEDRSLLERLYTDYEMEVLALPTGSEERFFPSQKEAFDNFGKQYFSYSAPTSMGKSFMMRVFVKQQIMAGKKENYAIIVPTKALINEVSTKLIKDLKGLLEEKDYRVVTSAGSTALEQKHNYVFILTPERMMYLLMNDKDLVISHMFIDEAHKISSSDKRSTIYFNIVDMLAERENKPHIIFASPNIPNPEVYLELIPEVEFMDNNLAMKYSPVSQFVYMVDYVDYQVHVYNHHLRTYSYLASLAQNSGLHDLISFVAKDDSGDIKQNLVYCSSKDKTVEFAKAYARKLSSQNNDKLNALARDIRNEVHGEYFLAGLIEKGVAYHIGYLPADIRMRIEDYYRERLITTLFCTSTLIEGVNLPADNLFITSYKSGLSHFKEVDFKNLMGRVGRIEFNLYGNVFVVRPDNKLERKKFTNLIESDVPRQQLSVVSELTKPQKEKIIEKLLEGDEEFIHYPNNQSEDKYDLMRKFGLILAKDIIKDRNSRVFREFVPLLDQDKIMRIKKAFEGKLFKPNDDITISSDQRENLYQAIRNGMEYPDIEEGRGADYKQTLAFMNRMLKIFKWDVYEKGTLGKTNRQGDFSYLAWYVVILLQWIQGYGLSNIIKESIEDKRKNNRAVQVSYGIWEPYDGSREHKNCIIAETLEAIDDVILFRISNYFLKFTEEYIRQHGECKNDWYEYVEYGTTNKLRITLQKSDFSREAATYIRKNQDDYVVKIAGNYKLKRSILECSSELVRREAADIVFNLPELFVD